MPLGDGTGPARSHAQPPFGGEHGEDPSLARSKHCGTPRARACARAKVSLRIQVFGAFFLANFNVLSCGYPSDGGLIPSFGGKLGGSIPSFGGRAVRLTVFRFGQRITV